MSSPLERLSVVTYPETALETMARELCRVRNEDPDTEMVDPNVSRGRMGGNFPTYPRWTFARNEVLKQLQVMHAIQIVLNAK